MNPIANSENCLVEKTCQSFQKVISILGDTGRKEKNKYYFQKLKKRQDSVSGNLPVNLSLLLNNKWNKY